MGTLDVQRDPRALTDEAERGCDVAQIIRGDTDAAVGIAPVFRGPIGGPAGLIADLLGDDRRETLRVGPGTPVDDWTAR